MPRGIPDRSGVWINVEQRYLCENGCCDVRVLMAEKRGVPAQVWVNGKLGSFAAWAKIYAISAEAVLARTKRQHCLNHRKSLTRREFRGSEQITQALAQKFLALPRPSRGEAQA